MGIRASAIWLLLLGIAVLSGTLRAAMLEPRFGEQTAHVIGTLAVVLVFAAVITATVRWVVPDLAPRRLFTLGAGWTAATVVFEFGFGRFVAGHPWDRLLADYHLAEGRIWIFVLATLLFAPPIAGGLRRRT